MVHYNKIIEQDLLPLAIYDVNMLSLKYIQITFELDSITNALG